MLRSVQRHYSSFFIAFDTLIPYNYIKDKVKTAMLYPHDSPIVGGSLVDFMRFFDIMPLSALIFYMTI